jgi:hypothetical protein
MQITIIIKEIKFKSMMEWSFKMKLSILKIKILIFNNSKFNSKLVFKINQINKK